jgi:arsenate reductase (thioredoxin)
MSLKSRVLFICTHNSCRSQMAEGLLQHLCGKRFEGFSAGIIKTHVHPLAINVMDEIGVDISKHVSKTVDEFRDEVFDYVVTVCDNAKETCPFFPGKNVIHKGFEDPSQQIVSSEDILEAFRMVRDEIKEFIVETFCNKK